MVSKFKDNIKTNIQDFAFIFVYNNEMQYLFTNNWNGIISLIKNWITV